MKDQLFNGEWHHIAVVLKNEMNHAKVALVIDGKTDIQSDEWNICLPRRPAALLFEDRGVALASVVKLTVDEEVVRRLEAVRRDVLGDGVLGLLQTPQQPAVDAQQALQLFYWEQLQTSEIASALGIPVSTVTTRISRARKSLLAAIEKLSAVDNQRKSLLGDFERWLASFSGLYVSGTSASGRE